MNTITHDQAMEQFKAQGVSAPRHYAAVCVSCGTVQSLASLVKAGATPEQAERAFAFSCEGRFSGAGPRPSDKDKSAKAAARRKVRGCDWTLGGLFTIHRLEILYPEGKTRPCFEIATPEQAQALERDMNSAIEPALKVPS